jgi:hypothetical protein
LAYVRQARATATPVDYERLGATVLTFEGYILQGTKAFSLARAAYRRALDLWETIHAQEMACMPLAGLAEICLVEGKNAEALSHVEVILSRTETFSRLLGLLLEPFWVCLVIYRVLRVHQDERAAEVLQRAVDLLLTQADRIGDPELRRAYLEDVPEHREVVALLEQSSAESCPA